MDDSNSFTPGRTLILLSSRSGVQGNNKHRSREKNTRQVDRVGETGEEGLKKKLTNKMKEGRR